MSMFHQDEQNKSKISTSLDLSSEKSNLPFIQKFISQLPKIIFENSKEDKFCFVKYDENNLIADVKSSEELQKCGEENEYQKILSLVK